MIDKSFDILVIGGGPGGYVAAIRAAQLGLKTALVESQHLGGICLNWGCIPTKALLRSAEVHHLIQHADQFGLKVKGVEIDFKKVIERSRGVANQLSKGIAHLLKKNKVTVIDGYGKLLGKGQVEVNKTTYSAKHIIIATGAQARVLPGLEPDGKLVWTYKEAMTPAELPKSLLVVGSGAIGIEFASFYRNMGVEVTVVEVMDRILPVEDEEISTLARKAFEKQGIKILTGATVKKLDKAKDSVTVSIEAGGKKEEMKVDRVIMAVGIVGNTENLGLEKTKVKVDRGHIVTNQYCGTDEPGVYAIGDVAGAPWLAHKASHEGVLCVEKIANVAGVHPMKRENIPGCTYAMPQVASVGLTEKAAKEKGYTLKVGRFPFVVNGKAIALGEPEGLVKTIFDAKTGELLGAHMIGAEVTELIQGYVIGKTAELTEAEFMHTVFAHPTLSEMMHESVLSAYGRAVHF
ncbi:MAG: dihydrolipoyl dehydrogenase [Alphaproteobacteria bacterium]|nr:dihydrolipoyl dehydrogenase [Alphaproteobacteria bacterium]